MQNVITERSAISALSRDTRGLLVVDLMIASAPRLTEALETAVASPEPVVFLSCQGVEQPRTEFLTVMAHREQQATRAVRGATVVRLAPVVEDLAVYESSFREGSPIYHSYAEGKAAWLAASDLGEFLDVLARHPQRHGRVYQLNGSEQASAPEIVERWGELGFGKNPDLNRVPPEVLSGHLESLVGAPAAAMIAGHQEWCGDHAARAERADTLRRALERDPLAWHEALARRYATV